MTSEIVFLRAMQEEDDDTSRLVFADWLDDRGDSARAELIRVQCELARWVPDLNRRTVLQQRESELLAEHGETWLGPLQVHCLSWRFERGLAFVTLRPDILSDRGIREVLNQAPIAGIRIQRGAALLSSWPDVLDDVTWLDLSGIGLTDHDTESLVRQAPLSRLRFLDLSNNDLTDAGLWSLLGSSRPPNLQHLALRNNRIGLGGTSKRFASLDLDSVRLDLHGNPVRHTVAHERIADRLNGVVWHEPGRPARLFNSIGMQLALVPSGTFLMGASADESGHFANEMPRHEVTLTQPFYLGLYPVTQRDYETVTGTNPSHFKKRTGGGPNHPVEEVSWDDAVEFCRQLSDLPAERDAGRVYRLPTEAEWEYACRAGTTTAFSWGPDGGSTLANFSGDHPHGKAPVGPYLQRTTPVGAYPPNAFGLYDMHGNVWEWCHDCYRADYYRNSPAQDPPGPKRGDSHVVRGGSWFIVGRGCRSAERCYTGEAPTTCTGSVGFRVAMTLQN